MWSSNSVRQIFALQYTVRKKQWSAVSSYAYPCLVRQPLHCFALATPSFFFGEGDTTTLGVALCSDLPNDRCAQNSNYLKVQI